ncbi:MAG: hypothetical protein ACUVTP_02735 [Candidatus Fervidibacter sp.]|uniref:hypothetical protein n=1 Tax=Candidatus Fervidibacter sp. TaxID=3100871 RepID=UPI004049EB2C
MSPQEALDIGQNARTPVHISHFKVVGKKQWGKASQQLALVDEARKKGMKVTLDCYPYTASSIGLTLLLPDWALEGGYARSIARLRHPSIRKRIVAAMIQKLRENGWQDFSFARIATFPPDLFRARKTE